MTVFNTNARSCNFYAILKNENVVKINFFVNDLTNTPFFVYNNLINVIEHKYSQFFVWKK